MTTARGYVVSPLFLSEYLIENIILSAIVLKVIAMEKGLVDADPGGSKEQNNYRDHM